ncbi:MAG: glycosyltransferase family 2 protein [Vulcanimicrobiaceae bacterium]
MKFSVVIATRDRAAMLGRAIDALATQRDAPAFETIVVDNGSRDATAEVVAARRDAAPLGVRRIVEPQPNRAAARNRGIAAAIGEVIAFIDDDVDVPPHFLAAHAASHARSTQPLVVSGPIINVASYDDKPRPTPLHYSSAYFCTCNVSVERAALLATGGFDERFDRYGWEDTELGLRLRRDGIRRRFAWDAYLHHVKPPATETFEVVLNKTMEKGRMAARLLRKDSSLRARLATGGYPVNELRAQLLVPRWTWPVYAGLATSSRAPAALRNLARAQILDGVYVAELRRARADGD